MKILICGNGNLTRKKDGLFDDSGNICFLQSCLEREMDISYAVLVLDENKETVRSNSNMLFPNSIKIEKFHSFSKMNFFLKLCYFPVILVHLIFLVFQYDFLYCFFPGTLGSLLLKLFRFFHKRYALYVRGELPNTKDVIHIIQGASFIYVTGTSIITRIVPTYKNCYEVAPMSSVFQKDHALVPKTAFHDCMMGLFVGRVERAKGVYELLDALKILKKEDVAFHMFFVGAYQDDFLAHIKELNLLSDITLVGLVPDNEQLESFYRNADFFCLPTWTEGFPRVLYEAMSYALPCITTMVGGIPSRMKDGENCLAIRTGSPESISDAIKTLITNRDSAKQLSAAALETFVFWKLQFAEKTHAGQLKQSIESLSSGV